MKNIEELVSRMVSIDSTNPAIVPGAAGEAEMARFIAEWLVQAGLDVQVYEVMPGRPNVVAIAHGTGGGKTLMFNGHLDTVGLNGMQNPHTPVIRDGRLFGRGAYDMKGGLAACMLTMAEAIRLRLAGDVIFTAVMDEEYTGLGTMEVAKKVRADAAIIAEPTELQLIVAHRGFVWLEVETQGVAAHGSRPHLGVDAILKMGKVLTALQELDLRLRANPTHPLLGSGSLHASFINGGQEPSTYPEKCTLMLERRTIPGETPETVEAEVEAILAEIAAGDPAFKAFVRRGQAQPPMETPADTPLLPILQQAAQSELHHPVEGTGVSYWTDAATLQSVGIPCVLFGPLGAGAHAAEEWVDLESIQACSRIYLETARSFCQ